LSAAAFRAFQQPVSLSSVSAAAPGMRLLRLHGCLHAFDNHRILKRHEVVEGSLFKRIFAEECEYPSRSDLLAARERNVLSRQVARLGDCRADPIDELPFRLDRQPWRDDKITDGAHWASEFTVDTCLLGRPLAKKDSRVGDRVRVVDERGDLVHEFLLDIDRKVGRQIEICDGHFEFSFNAEDDGSHSLVWNTSKCSAARLCAKAGSCCPAVPRRRPRHSTAASATSAASTCLCADRLIGDKKMFKIIFYHSTGHLLADLVGFRGTMDAI